MHLSEIARSLKENITLKKTIERLSRSLNLLATLAAGYIRLTSTVRSESISLEELKECSKRIYEIPEFIFYALGYAPERVLSMSRSIRILKIWKLKT